MFFVPVAYFAAFDMETGVRAGDSSCGNTMAHESFNNAKSVNEAITIEFKNRDSFKP